MGFSNEQDTVEWLRIKGVPCDEKGAHIYKTTLPSPWSEVELADVRKVPHPVSLFYATAIAPFGVVSLIH